MRKFFILSALSIIGTAGSVFAQSPSAVSGTVKDNTAKPLQSVTVSLLNAADSTLVKTDVTDKKGDFEINTSKEGNFLLSYSSVGFEQQYSAVFEKKTGSTVYC